MDQILFLLKKGQTDITLFHPEVVLCYSDFM